MSYDDFDDDHYYLDTDELLQKLRRDLHKATKEIVKAQEKGLKNDAQMIDAFNRVAKAMEGLTEEVKGLRADLNPQLDKPGRLPGPAKGL